MKKSILFLFPYDVNQNPSQRFRAELFLDTLLKHGYKIKIEPFFNKKVWSFIFKEGYHIKKILYTLIGLTKRIFTLFTIYKYSTIYIHREATPFGFPFFEFIVCKVFKKHVVYDLDDAIWLKNKHASNNAFSFLRNPNKVNKIIKWASVVSVGCQNIYEYCAQLNKNCKIIPTAVDTNYHHPSVKTNNTNALLRVGWTGSHTTISYLSECIPVLNEIYVQKPFTLVVICSKPPSFKFSELEFIEWNVKKEIDQLNTIDIGIMPLPNEEWTKYKCGFKIIQYLALEIPCIASPIGVNKAICEQTDCGYLAENREEWKTSLLYLLNTCGKTKNLGKSGREMVLENYSKIAVEASFLELFA